MNKFIYSAVAGALVFTGASAFANPKVYSPSIEKGEAEIEYRGEYTFDKDAAKDKFQQHLLGVGYGFTEHFLMEVYGELENEGKNDTGLNYTATEVETKFNFGAPGQYWADYGGLVEYEFSNENNHPDEISARFLVEKQFYNFTHTLNIIAGSEVGNHAADGLEAGLAWSSTYHVNQYFEPGVEIYNNFGNLRERNSFERQDHSFGPVINGSVGDLKYNIGYIIGVTDGAPEGTAKWNIEYEF